MKQFSVPEFDMHYTSDGSRGLGLIWEVLFDRLLILAVIAVSLVIGSAILSF